MVVVRFGSVTATLANSAWRCAEPSWTTVLDGVSDCFVPSPYDDEPDQALADYVARQMHGVILAWDE